MRKFLIPFLLAGVAASPAAAQFPRQHIGERESNQAERSNDERPDFQQDRTERRSDRDNRAERDARVERQNDQPAVRPWANRMTGDAQNADQRPADRAQVMEQIRQRQHEYRRPDATPPTPNANANVNANADARANFRDRIDRQRTTQAGQQRNDVFERIRAERRNAPPPMVSPVPRPNSQPPEARGDRRVPNWSRDWRHDDRYDWRRHRDHHRSWFHLGFYSDPFGWGYEPYSIGWRMWPSYYSRNYWLNDPWQYRLPYAPPGTRWVRYYNDAVLVDTWDGQVMDVIYNFFW